MAIAFARVSIHTRSKGHSAVAASSYRSGIHLHDERTGKNHDYSHRHDVIFSEVLLPKDADAIFSNREILWNAVERAERRCDAQLCKDVVLALPKELDRVEQIELTRRFANTHFITQGIPADISIHDHGDGNPHAHILIPTRRLEGKQFSKYKARDLNPTFAKGMIVENDYWGEQWREMQNEFFIEQNLDLQVDLNHLISERHQGRNREGKDCYLLEEKQLIQQARIEVTRDNIENVINHLSLKHSVFTRRDIERLLFKTFQPSSNHQEYLQFVEKIMRHKDVICLGNNSRGLESFTTRNHFLHEAELLENIESLMASQKHAVSRPIEHFSTPYNLTEEQREAFHYICRGPDISVVIGRPGTGKSYLLRPVNKYYSQNGHTVIGASLSGKVAKALETETGIHSFTIKSLSYRLSNNLLQLSNKHVIVIDEAGMVDFANMSYLIREAKKARAKLILIGDPDQLKPINKGEIFRGIAARTGYIELESIKRQEDAGDRKASLNLAKGNFDKAIKHYQNKKAINFSNTTLDACEHLIADWKNDLKNTKVEDIILLSFTRRAVRLLNDQAREALINEHKLGQENIIYQGMERPLIISTGERLLFRENNKSLGIRNGDTATVTSVSSKQMRVRLDSGETLVIPKEYQALDYAYALTVHKSQGMTVKKVKVLIDSKYWDRNLSFVAMTRHKETLNLYSDKENHPTPEALLKTLSRHTTKDNVIDWPLDFASRAGFSTDSLIGKAINHIAGVGHKIKEAYNFIVNYEAQLLKSYPSEQSLDLKAKRALAKAESIKIEAMGTFNLEHQIKTKELKKMEKDFPLVKEYISLTERRGMMTGYLAEKAEKRIHLISKRLLKNIDFIEQAKRKLPQLLSNIQKVDKQQEKILVRDD